MSIHKCSDCKKDWDCGEECSYEYEIDDNCGCGEDPQEQEEPNDSPVDGWFE